METVYTLALIGFFWVHFIEAKSLQTSMVISTELPSDINSDNSTETDLNKVSHFIRKYYFLLLTVKMQESSIQPEIQEMLVEANVANRYSKTSITSKVQNNDTKGHEATFTVIIPDNAFISGFVMEIDGKKYKALVQEQEEAKRTYSNAILKGYSAGHVGVSARDSNRFTVLVNIQPQSNSTFYLTYEELLARKEEKYEVVLNVHPEQLVKNFTVQVRHTINPKLFSNFNLITGKHNGISSNKVRKSPGYALKK